MYIVRCRSDSLPSRKNCQSLVYSVFMFYILHLSLPFSLHHLLPNSSSSSFPSSLIPPYLPSLPPSSRNGHRSSPPSSPVTPQAEEHGRRRHQQPRTSVQDPFRRLWIQYGVRQRWCVIKSYCVCDQVNIILCLWYNNDIIIRVLSGLIMHMIGNCRLFPGEEKKQHIQCSSSAQQTTF